MRVLLGLALIAFVTPSTSYADGKPRVMGFTRKALRAALVPKIEGARLLTTAEASSPRLQAFSIAASTARIQLTGKEGKGNVALVSTDGSYHPGKVLLLSQRPEGAATWRETELPQAK